MPKSSSSVFVGGGVAVPEFDFSSVDAGVCVACCVFDCATKARTKSLLNTNPIPLVALSFLFVSGFCGLEFSWDDIFFIRCIQSSPSMRTFSCN